MSGGESALLFSADDEWRPAGLTLLDSSDKHAAVVFAARNDLDRFERRLAKDSTASTREQSPPDPHRRRYVTLFTRTLQVALGLLDPNDRERLRLYYAEAQTLAQIGRKLGEHESSVSRNLDRIRRQLRSEVETALRDPRVATNGANPEPGLSEEQIAQCFEYAAEDAPIDLDQLLPSNDQKPERLDP